MRARFRRAGAWKDGSGRSVASCVQQLRSRARRAGHNDGSPRNLRPERRERDLTPHGAVRPTPGRRRTTAMGRRPVAHLPGQGRDQATGLSRACGSPSGRSTARAVAPGDRASVPPEQTPTVVPGAYPERAGRRLVLLRRASAATRNSAPPHSPRRGAPASTESAAHSPGKSPGSPAADGAQPADPSPHPPKHRTASTRPLCGQARTGHQKDHAFGPPP